MQIAKKQARFRTSYEILRKIEPFYSGGNIVLAPKDDDLYTILDESINVLNIDTGESVQIKCEIGPITCMAISPDGLKLASASKNSLVTLWTVATREKIRDWKVHDSIVLSMAFDGTSGLLSIAMSDGLIQVWDIVRNYCTHNLRGHSGIVTCIAFHPDPMDGLLASCSNDNTVRLWNLKNNKKTVFSEHKSTVTSVAFACHGSYLVSGGRDGVIAVWEVKTHRNVKIITSPDTVESIVVVPQSSPLYNRNTYSCKPLVCSLGSTGVIRVWDVLSGSIVKEFSQSPEISVSSISVSMSGNYLISVNVEHDISLHRFDSAFTKVCVKSGSPADILSLAPLSDSDPDYIAVATSSNFLRIYNTATKDCLILQGHSSVIMSVTSNQRASMIATCGRDDTVLIWKYQLGGCEYNEGRRKMECVLCASCTGHTDTVNAVSWKKKSGDILISASADCTVKSWNVKLAADATHEPVRLSANYTIIAHEKEVRGIDTSNNGKFFATASSDKTAKLWNLDTGEQLGEFKGHTRGLWCVRFSSTDQLLATGSADKSIRLWNVNDFTCVNRFEGHLNSVVDLVFISRGFQVASCGSDGLLKIWDVNTSTCQKTLGDHDDRVWALCTIKDGEFLISGSSDECVFIWKDATQEEESIKTKQRENLILLEQDLSNAMHRKNYLTSIKLLLHLEHQADFLAVLRQLIEPLDKTPQSVSHEQLKEIIMHLNDDELSRLLQHCRCWNTNWRHVHVAQKMLSCVMACIPVDRISRLKGIADVLSVIKDYSESHYKSIDNLHTDLHIMDYLIAQSVGFDVQTIADGSVTHEHGA